MTSRQRIVHRFKTLQKTTALSALVAGQPNARDFSFQIDGTEEVSEEKKSTVHDTEKKRTFAAVMARDTGSKLPDARANFRLGEKNATGRHATIFLKF